MPSLSTALFYGCEAPAWPSWCVPYLWNLSSEDGRRQAALLSSRDPLSAEAGNQVPENPKSGLS